MLFPHDFMNISRGSRALKPSSTEMHEYPTSHNFSPSAAHSINQKYRTCTKPGLRGGYAGLSQSLSRKNGDGSNANYTFTFSTTARGVSQNGRMESAARLEEERGEGEIPPRESGGFFPSFPIPLSHPNPSEMFPLSLMCRSFGKLVSLLGVHQLFGSEVARVQGKELR